VARQNLVDFARPDLLAAPVNRLLDAARQPLNHAASGNLPA
jgi:hypothetical protein